MSNRSKAGASAQAGHRIAVLAAREHARKDKRHPSTVADDADATDLTTNQAPRAYSYLPGGWNDYVTPVTKANAGRMLKYTHVEGDLDAKPMWWERGTPCLFDRCQGGEGNKTRRPGDNAWHVPKGTSLANGLVLAKERERDELELLVLAWRERQQEGNVHG